MRWEHNNTSGLYRLNFPSGLSLSVDPRNSFFALTRDGHVAPPDLSKYGGPTPQQQAQRYCATLEALAPTYNVSNAELAQIKKQATSQINPPLEELAVPEIERGISLGALFLHDGWTVSLSAFYDLERDRSYSLSTRWRNTPERVMHETVDDYSLAPLRDHKRSFLETTGLPNTTRNRIHRLFRHWERI